MFGSTDTFHQEVCGFPSWPPHMRARETISTQLPYSQGKSHCQVKPYNPQVSKDWVKQTFKMERKCILSLWSVLRPWQETKLRLLPGQAFPQGSPPLTSWARSPTSSPPFCKACWNIKDILWFLSAVLGRAISGESNPLSESILYWSNILALKSS